MYRFRTAYPFQTWMIAALAGVFLLPACAVSAAPRNRAQTYTDPDAYAVYSAVLPQMWPWVQLDAMNLVVRVETKAHVVCVAPEKPTDSVASSGPNSNGGATDPPAPEASDHDGTASAIAQYNLVNRHTWILERKLHIARAYTLIGAGELEDIAHHEIGAWDLFFERHGDSGGWIQFSAVGFSPDKKTAVVYAEYACGQQCGGGALYRLHKKGAQWVVAEPPVNSCSDKRSDRQMTGM